MNRFLELFLTFLSLTFLLIPMVIIGILVKIDSNGSVLFWSDRIGKNSTIFKMPKYRTMSTDAPLVATHLLNDSEHYVTKLGNFLRKTSLDELPQIFSIIKGDMSIVGPRPALFNQDDLISLRKKYKIDKLRPGITGWAQINGRDNVSIIEKVALEKEYLSLRSTIFDLKVIFSTLKIVLLKQNIKH